MNRRLPVKKIIAVLLFALLTLGLAARTLVKSELEDNGFKRVEQDGFIFRWRIVDDKIEINIQAPTQGWVGIGFNPDSKMEDADYIIGYVKNGEVTLSDDYGATSISHRRDDRGGGENNLTLIAGSEVNGSTSLTVRKPLDSGDNRDQPMSAGEIVDVLFAWGGDRADNLRSIHAKRGSFRVKL